MAGTRRAPTGLRDGGRTLWREIVSCHDLDAAQRVQLEEACRAKDRLDLLDALLRDDTEVWTRLVYRTNAHDYELKIDAALVSANATANLMKQLLAALRLPDEQTGKRPQYRGPRGAQAPSTPGGAKAASSDAGGRKVSSLERARAARSS